LRGFTDILAKHDWEDTRLSIKNKTEEDVKRALHSQKRTLEDFKALIALAALPFLEDMANLSKAITQKRFGKTIQMYIPMYLSNECQNICTYCGFSMDNAIPRITLTKAQIIAEAKAIKKMGYDHILVLTGEANKTVGFQYIYEALKTIKPHLENRLIKYIILKVENRILSGACKPPSDWEKPVPIKLVLVHYLA